MVYTTYTIVRAVTNLSTTDISNDDLTTLITYTTRQLNKDISVEVIREKIEPIDTTRENEIDGVNKTYYIKNWEDKYFADKNDDGSITTADVTVYQVASDGTETTLTVSTISETNKSFTLSSAPAAGVELFITYSWSYVSSSNNLVQMAATMLTAAWAYARIHWGKPTSARFGDTTIMRHMAAFDLYYNRYLTLLQQINDKNFEVGEVPETNKI